MINGRIAITLSQKGIDTVSFVSSNKAEALNLFLIIKEELENFEDNIKKLIESHEVKENDFNQ